MNLDMVKITEDQLEMIAIGKEIVDKNPEKYSGEMMNLIMGSIKNRFPKANQEEINNQIYLTIYHYWTYGASFDEYYYYDFPNKTHEQKKEYMLFQVRMMYGKHLNELDKAHLLMNKYETYQFFKEEYLRDMIWCKSEDDYTSFSNFCSMHPVFVVKPTDMGGGRGVHKDSVVGMTESEKKNYFSSLLKEGKENKAKYLRGNEPSVILEEVIDQDERLGIFNSESVNAVRVNTFMKNDEIIVFEPWLKIGRGGNFLTSAVFGTMDAGIDPKTGIVDTFGYTETGEIWEKHPDNGIEIKGFEVPRWNELIELAKKCALRMPFFKYIAWDIALSKKGWCIMEANYCGDFMWQLYRNKGMKKEFEELIGWKMEKDFWWQ